MLNADSGSVKILFKLMALKNYFLIKTTVDSKQGYAKKLDLAAGLTYICTYLHNEIASTNTSIHFSCIDYIKQHITNYECIIVHFVKAPIQGLQNTENDPKRVIRSRSWHTFHCCLSFIVASKFHTLISAIHYKSQQ